MSQLNYAKTSRLQRNRKNKISLWGCTSKSNFPSPLTSSYFIRIFFSKPFSNWIMLRKKKREKWIQWLILGRNWSDRFDSVFVISNISFFAGGGRFSCPSLSEDNSKDYTLFLINKDNKHRSKHMQPQWKKRGVNYLIFLRGANKCLRRFSFKWYFFF